MLKAECAGVQCLPWAEFKGIADESLVCRRRLSAKNLHAAITLVGKEGMPD